MFILRKIQHQKQQR